MTSRKKTNRSSKWADVSPAPSPPQPFKVGVSLKNLRKIYPISGGEKRIAVNNISLDFYVDEVTALLGHNGAGKSTMM